MYVYVCVCICMSSRYCWRGVLKTWSLIDNKWHDIFDAKIKNCESAKINFLGEASALLKIFRWLLGVINVCVNDTRNSLTVIYNSSSYCLWVLIKVALCECHGDKPALSARSLVPFSSLWHLSIINNEHTFL